MNKTCYTTADDYFEAEARKKEIVTVLKEARRAILMGQAKMPDYWHDSCGQHEQYEVIHKIDKLIPDLI